MDKMALINGKMEELSEADRKAGERFHKLRTPFIWINGEFKVNLDPDDVRDHHHWVTEDFGLTDEEFEELPRGYIIQGRMQLFKGSSFKEIPPEEMNFPFGDFLKVIEIYKTRYPNQDDKFIDVFNGVEIGKVGEIWPPKTHLMRITLDDDR